MVKNYLLNLTGSLILLILMSASRYLCSESYWVSDLINLDVCILLIRLILNVQ